MNSRTAPHQPALTPSARHDISTPGVPIILAHIFLEVEFNDTYTANKAEFDKIFGTTENLGNLIVRLSIAAHAFRINKRFTPRKFGIGWHQFLAGFTSVTLDHIFKTGAIPDDETIGSLIDAALPPKPPAKSKPPRSKKRTPASRVTCPAKDIYGLACPYCGRSDKLLVKKICFVHLEAQGHGTIEEAHWGVNSECNCETCNIPGPVGLFIADQDKWDHAHE